MYSLVLGTTLSLLHGYSIHMLHWISTSKCPLQKVIMMSAELREPTLITNSLVFHIRGDLFGRVSAL